MAKSGEARRVIGLVAAAASLIAALSASADATGPLEAGSSADAINQSQIDVSQAGREAPSLLAKTSTGVPLGVRLLLRQPVPEASNFFTESTFGTYVDGVYFARPYNALYDFIDLDRIAVSPSAQGATAGRNTADGAIHIWTKRPSDKFTWASDVSAGSYGWLDARTAVSGAIVPHQIAASFSFLYRHRDGLMDDSFLHEKVNERDYQAARARFLITPSDKWDIDVAIDGVHDRSSPKFPAAIVAPRPGADPSAVIGRDIFATEAVTPDFNQFDQGGISVANRYRFGQSTLNAISSVRELRSASYVSYDATPANTLSTESFVRREEYVEDVNLGTGTETVGLFYFHRDTNQWTPTGGSPNVSAESDNSYAFYANATREIASSLHAFAGLRYTMENKDLFSWFYAGNSKATPKAIPAGLVPRQTIAESWDGLTPNFTLDYDVTSQLLAYFSYQRGFKSGGWSNRLPPNYGTGGSLIAKPAAYPAQTENQFEIGLRATLIEEALFLHAAAYRNDYHDLQIPVLLAGTSTYYLTSAPAATVDGLEIGATWRAAPELELYGLTSFQHGRYGAGFYCQNTASLNADCSANRLVGLSPLRVMAGFSYQPKLALPGQIKISGSATYGDRYQNSVANVFAASTASHTLYDAAIGYDFPDGHWSMSLEARNLTDIHWFAAAAQSGTSVAVYPDDPRTFLLRARYRF